MYSNTSHRLVTGARASAILYHFLHSLSSHPEQNTWLIPANACAVLPLTFLKAAKKIEIIDINPATLCIDEQQLAERIQANPSRYQGILLIDTYGLAKDWFEFASWLKQQYPVLLVHDKCASPPVHPENNSLLIDLYLYSTGYAKYIDLRYGGFGLLKHDIPYHTAPLAYASPDLQEIDKLTKQLLARRKPFAVPNSNWLDAGLLPVTESAYFNAIRQKLPIIQKHKDLLNSLYTQHLPSSVQLPAGFHDWRFQILVPKREELLSKLFSEGLFASSHYASLAGVFSADQAPYAERLSSKITNLFNDFYYTAEQAVRTIGVIERHFNRYGPVREAPFQNFMEKHQA